MTIPGREDTENAIKFLQATQGHLKDYNKAKAVLSRGSQYNDFVRDFQKTMEGFSNRGLAEVLGQLENYYGYVKNGKITESQYQKEVASRLKSYGGEEAVKKELETKKKLLEQYSDYISEDQWGKYNQLLSGVKKFAPKVDTSQYTSTKSTSNGSSSSTTTGGATTGSSSTSSSSRGSSQNNSFTGWAKVAYQKALQFGGSPADYAPSFVKNSPVHASTLARIQDAVNVARQSSGVTGDSGTVSTGMESALADLEEQYKSGKISRETYDLFKLTVENWDPNSEINPSNIVNTFKEIQANSIDPYFRGLTNVAIETIKNNSEQMLKDRALELENEGIDAETAIETAKADLESRGMYFSGSARRQLGGQSAFAQGTANADSRIPFGGAEVEGYIQKKNRLISSSSKARYEQQRRALGLQAESTLGSGGISGLFSDYNAIGGVTGDIQTQKEGKEASTLSSIIAQQSANLSQNQLLDTEI